MDTPSGSPPLPSPQSDALPNPDRRPTHAPFGCLRGLALMGAIALPVIALVVELASRMCAVMLFDPLPTWFNVMLVTCVPIAALMSVRPRAQYSAWHTRFHGFALGVCAAYCIPSGLVAPLALIGIFAYGIGLLPLSPFIGFVGLIAAFDEARLRGAMASKTLLRGALAGFAAVLLTYTPSLVTDVLTQRYFEVNADERPAAFAALRRFGSAAVLHARIEGRSVLPTKHVGEHGYLELYHRVTGERYEGPGPSERGNSIFELWERDLDRDHGGD
jgi:hypothetical protein